MTFVKADKGTTNNKNDKCMTPHLLARKLIRLLPLYDSAFIKILDPFRGTGAFFNNFPEYTDKRWCEIDNGRDFFDCTDKVDWIISNPPYSIFDAVLDHSFDIADNVVYLVPCPRFSVLWLEYANGKITATLKTFGYCPPVSVGSHLDFPPLSSGGKKIIQVIHTFRK